MEFSRQEYWSGYILFPRGSSQLRDCTHVSYIAGRFFMVWATMGTQWSQYCISNTQHCKWIVHWNWATRQIENTSEGKGTAHILKKQCVQFNLFWQRRNTKLTKNCAYSMNFKILKTIVSLSFFLRGLLKERISFFFFFILALVLILTKEKFFWGRLCPSKAFWH